MHKMILGVLAALIATTPALAQQRQEFSFTYSGRATTSPTQGATTNGGQPWSSQPDAVLPRYPIEAGDNVTIRLSGDIPVYEGSNLPSSNGIYSSRLTGAGVPGADNPLSALVNMVEISGIVGNRIVPGLFGTNGLEILYDSGTQTYSLGVGENVFLGTLNLPDYILSENEQNVRTATLRNNPPVGSQQGWSNARGSGNSLTLEGTDISFGSRGTVNGSTGPLNIDGSFGNLIVGGTSGNPIEIPEPSMILLFGGASAALIRRRRRLKKASAPAAT